MDFTFAQSVTTVFGNKRVIQGVLTADAASGIVSFGFQTLEHVQWAPASATTNGSGVWPRFRMNKNANGSSSAGDLGVSGVVSGDEFFVTVYGR
jgi:hypothetical protein